jgi:hypothetical protein
MYCEAVNVLGCQKRQEFLQSGPRAESIYWLILYVYFGGTQFEPRRVIGFPDAFRGLALGLQVNAGIGTPNTTKPPPTYKPRCHLILVA